MSQSLKPKDVKKLAAIEELLNRKEVQEALEAAIAFSEERPNLPEAWEMLGDIAETMRVHYYLWLSMRRLCQLAPHDEYHRYNFTIACMYLDAIFLATQSVGIYLSKFPRGIFIEKIKEMKTALDNSLQEMIDSGAPPNVDRDAMALLETGRILITHGATAEGRRASLEAAKRLPDNPAALNNVSLSYMVDGNLDRALATVDEVLTSHADNLFAQSTKVQLLVKLGRGAEAQPLLEALAREDPTDTDPWLKIMEACAFAHEHQKVLDVYRRAIPFFASKSRDIIPMMHHFAGAAHAFLGNARAAQSEWKKVPDTDPAGALASANLREFRQHGPWYFGFSQWIPHNWLKSALVALGSPAKRTEEAARRAIERLIARTPGLASTTSLLLERGDPDGLEFALQMAKFHPLPGLADFARAQRGTDENRIEALNLAISHGLISSAEPVTMTVGGQSRDLILQQYEIYTEPDDEGNPLPPLAQARLEASNQAIVEGDPERSLREAEAGLAIAPDGRALLNHKASALHMLKRHDEANAINRELAETHPEYFFARLAMAEICIREQRFDDAEAWLTPLREQSRMHISEFRGLALIFIELWIQKGDASSAKNWLDLLDSIDPDSITDALRHRVGTVDLLGTLKKIPSRLRKKK